MNVRGGASPEYWGLTQACAAYICSCNVYSLDTGHAAMGHVAIHLVTWIVGTHSHQVCTCLSKVTEAFRYKPSHGYQTVSPVTCVRRYANLALGLAGDCGALARRSLAPATPARQSKLHRCRQWSVPTSAFIRDQNAATTAMS